jgi:pantetheine-phosphate adenylyltransferase
MKKVIYPGTFDPVTNGHIDLIQRAGRMFDLVYVGVVADPQDKPLFSVQERVEMVTVAVKHFKNIKVLVFEGLLVSFASKIGVSAIIRGIRAISDFDYEFQMALTNRRMSPKIETIFMLPSESYSYLSSSLVREIAQLGGNLKGLVPEVVIKKLKGKLGGRR